MGRPAAPEPPPPGLNARVAAARAVAEAIVHGRPLEERLAADIALRGPGVDPRDPGLARSIATASLRRLGTIRKALAERLEKGMPKRSGALEWTLDRRRRATSLPRPAGPRGGRPRGARRAG